MRLVYHELGHFFVGGVISGFLYWRYKSVKLVFIAFIITFLLDSDHLIDLILAKGSLTDIFTGNYFATSQKAYVFLHSWELLIPWWIYTIYVRKYSLGWAVTLAFVGHIMVDQFSYSTQPLTYFLSYRYISEFNLKELFIPH